MENGFATYDPSQVSVTLGEILMSGFAEDSMIEAERPEPTYADVAGADGQVTRAKTSDKRGTVTIHLMQSSDTNDLLSALHIADEQSNAGVRPLMIKDMSGTTVLSASHAWIERPAAANFAKGAGERVWVIKCARLEFFVGGN